MNEAKKAVPQAGADEPMVSWDMFLVYLTAFGGQGANHPLVWQVLDELGLAERNAFTRAEMQAIEKALAAKIQLKLACSNDPRAHRMLKLLSHANKMVEAHAASR